MRASGELKADTDTILFGESREFLEPRSRTQDRTPLVNNIVAAHVFADQYGRVYAYADPLGEEYDTESKWVPWVPATDRLFVAITNETRQNAEDLAPETQELPQPDDVLFLTRDGTSLVMRVRVDAVQEPTAQQRRISSALITLDGLVRISDTGAPTPHALFESAINLLLLRGRAATGDGR